MKSLYIPCCILFLFSIGCINDSQQPLNPKKDSPKKVNRPSNGLVVKPGILYDAEKLPNPLKDHLDYSILAHGSIAFHTDEEQWIAVSFEKYEDGVKVTNKGGLTMRLSVRGTGSISIMIHKPYECDGRLNYRRTYCIDTDPGLTAGHTIGMGTLYWPLSTPEYCTDSLQIDKPTQLSRTKPTALWRCTWEPQPKNPRLIVIGEDEKVAKDTKIRSFVLSAQLVENPNIRK